MPPNLPYIHKNLCPWIETDGWDPHRPKTGYIILSVSQDKKAQNIAHQVQGTTGMYPPIVQAAMDCASVGGTHVTVTFRLARHQVVSAITGKVFRADCNAEFGKVVQEGHLYYELSEHTTEEEAMALSAYVNKDHDNCQGTIEVELLQDILNTAKEMLNATGTRVTQISKVIAGLQKKSSSLCNPTAVGALAHYCLHQGAGPLVEEVVRYHAMNVSPQDFSID